MIRGGGEDLRSFGAGSGGRKSKMSQSEGVSAENEEIAQLREIFMAFDKNNDGSITELELESLLRSVGLKPSPEQLETLIEKADTNNNGLIEFSEFVSLVAPEAVKEMETEKNTAPPRPYTEEQLRAIFRLFDRNGNGYITAAELAHSMARLGHALTVKELTGMIREADTDGDGQISFPEFANAISSAAVDNAWAS
uniref:TSA: Wollemia nobilis Ref_Wollemi_Transcript_13937_1139 transcribed RNA sequence n=1 Tax=Wollemia nobilis TaxID=56998 RepID=A0A0C9QQE5_9CONI